MKKILFSLIALVCSMSMNAQVMKIFKGGELVKTYTAEEADSVAFEEGPLGKTGTAKRTGGIEVAWVQLWENGPRFAEYNVGAANNIAEDCGGYYRWGNSIDQDPNAVKNEGNDVLTGTNDIATNLWGSNWRMPTQEEFNGLTANCDKEWTTVNDVKGCKFTGKGDYATKSIFLPAAGMFSGAGITSKNEEGFYWTSMPNGSNSAMELYLKNGYQLYTLVQSEFRVRGFAVRAVLAE